MIVLYFVLLIASALFVVIIVTNGKIPSTIFESDASRIRELIKLRESISVTREQKRLTRIKMIELWMKKNNLK